MAVPENIIRALDRYARACVEMGVNPGDDDKALACVEERIALVRLLEGLTIREETWRRRSVAVAEALEQIADCEEHRPCGLCRERLRAAFAAATPAPATPPEATARTPIHWLGDATQDCDVWELNHRYERGRLTVLGSPTRLYLRMDDGTQVLVPVGWWIGDRDGLPFASSARPGGPTTPEGGPRDAR